ncbi:hypothetical protein BGW80DRAFT_1309286 [Lactifluus volemus]|nr:hypothetical protein BGW80DRAFT_1309286 [Lactifluus volemus]
MWSHCVSALLLACEHAHGRLLNAPNSPPISQVYSRILFAKESFPIWSVTSGGVYKCCTVFQKLPATISLAFICAQPLASCNLKPTLPDSLAVTLPSESKGSSNAFQLSDLQSDV